MKGIIFMQVSNNTPLAFGSIHVNTSRMNKVQRDISNRIAGYLEYAPEYLAAHEKGYDVYFLPGHNPSAVKVRYIDRNSDCFIKGLNNKILTTSVYNGSRITNGEKIASTLQAINDGLCKLAEFDARKIFNKETDVAKLRPESYSALETGIDDLSQVMHKESMIDYLADEHVTHNLNFSKDSDF